MTRLDIQLGHVTSNWQENDFSAYECHLRRYIKGVYFQKGDAHLERVVDQRYGHGHAAFCSL